MDTFLIVYGLINLLVFVVYGMDKYKAIHKRYRIPEAVLLWLSVVGIVGAITGMLAFWHKVRKTGFCFVIGMILVAEGFIATWLLL